MTQRAVTNGRFGLYIFKQTTIDITISKKLKILIQSICALNV